MLFAVRAKAQATMDLGTKVLISNFQHMVKSETFSGYFDFYFIILVQIELYYHSTQNIALWRFLHISSRYECPNSRYFFNAFFICTSYGILLDLRDSKISPSFEHLISAVLIIFVWCYLNQVCRISCTNYRTLSVAMPNIMIFLPNIYF